MAATAAVVAVALVDVDEELADNAAKVAAAAAEVAVAFVAAVRAPASSDKNPP